jgi:hypothetical protein
VEEGRGEKFEGNSGATRMLGDTRYIDVRYRHRVESVALRLKNRRGIANCNREGEMDREREKEREREREREREPREAKDLR